MEGKAIGKRMFDVNLRLSDEECELIYTILNRGFVLMSDELSDEEVYRGNALVQTITYLLNPENPGKTREAVC